MRHLAKLLLVALTLLPLASPAAAPAQNLVVQVATEPPGLDLTATPASATAGVVFYNVQEALVKVDRHGKLVPWLAEKWHTSDNKNYTFFLQARRPLPQRSRDEGRRREVRLRSGDEPGDEASGAGKRTRRSPTSSSRTTTRSRSR